MIRTRAAELLATVALLAATVALSVPAPASATEPCPTLDTSPNGVRLIYPNGNVDTVRRAGPDLAEIHTEVRNARPNRPSSQPFNLWLGGVFHMESRLTREGGAFLVMDRQPSPELFLPLEVGGAGRFRLAPRFAYGAPSADAQGDIEVTLDVLEARRTLLASGCAYDIVIVRLAAENQTYTAYEGDSFETRSKVTPKTPPTFVVAAPGLSAPLAMALSLDELTPERIGASLPLSAEAL